MDSKEIVQEISKKEYDQNYFVNIVLADKEVRDKVNVINLRVLTSRNNKNRSRLRLVLIIFSCFVV